MKPLGKESNELFSEIILELYKNPLNFGEMKDASAQAELGNPSCEIGRASCRERV